MKNKILLNLLILFNISVVVFAIQNKDFIFTKEFLGVIENYNNEIGNQIIEYIEGIWKSDVPKDDEIETTINEEEQDTSQIQQEEKTEISQSSSISEMELDIQNLKAAYTFIKPIEGTISSGFGARESEYQNVTGYHTGIDIAKELGSSVNASLDGKVIKAGYNNGGYGNLIVIEHGNNMKTYYAHLSEIYVNVGDMVKKDDIIGAIGSTGNSTGPHLHFELRVDNQPVDPVKYIQQ